MPGRKLTGVTMGQQRRTIKFRRRASGLYSLATLGSPAVQKGSARQDWGVRFFAQLLPENRSSCYRADHHDAIERQRASSAAADAAGPLSAYCTLPLRSSPAASGTKEKKLRGSAQPLEKARFGRGNPRESKRIPLIGFAPPWPGFG